MHRDMRLVAVLERHGRRADLLHLICRQQPHSIYQDKIRHSPLLPSRPSGASRFRTIRIKDARIALIEIMADIVRDTVILGSGCAGLTAAIYTARANLKPLVLEGHEPGGQLSITTLVENFPGWPDGIQGPDLIENMKKQATRFGAEFRMANLVSADLSERPFVLNLGAETIRTRTLIIASGASARWLGLPSEQALIGHGVSSCATCDGFFFSGKEIAVIGGGDSAMEEALFLTRFASKVYLLHRSDNYRASHIMLDRARANEKIEFISNVLVDEVLGVEQKEVTGLRLKHTKNGGVTTLPVTGMFLGIGHEPNTKPFVGQIELDSDGYVVTHDDVHTRVEGVFACGDVQDRRYRQAITAAGSGCAAALEAEKYLEAHGR
jgi:thioredoxin reductase (NADPH)